MWKEDSGHWKSSEKLNRLWPDFIAKVTPVFNFHFSKLDMRYFFFTCFFRKSEYLSTYAIYKKHEFSKTILKDSFWLMNWLFSMNDISWPLTKFLTFDDIKWPQNYFFKIELKNVILTNNLNTFLRCSIFDSISPKCLKITWELFSNNKIIFHKFVFLDQFATIWGLRSASPFWVATVFLNKS